MKSNYSHKHNVLLLFVHIIFYQNNKKGTLWNGLKFDGRKMLSRRGIYTTAKGTHPCRLGSMGPYNIELNSIKSALKTSDLKRSSFDCMTSHQCSAAASAVACAHTNANNKMPIKSISLGGNLMDLEFNIQGCDLYKS